MSIQQSTPRRILGIIGSPRRDGNTKVLVDTVLQAAREAGALAESVVLSEMEIEPCTACDVCRDTGRCIIEDEMHGLLEKMEASDVWVLGTPVYWWGPTAQFKAFLDRWYGAGEVVSFRGKEAILVIPLGDSNARTARHTVGMLEDALAYVGVRVLAKVLAPGVGGAGTVRGREGIMEEARRAGRLASGVPWRSG
jgi:multimeric flavodoxin WrbA